MFNAKAMFGPMTEEEKLDKIERQKMNMKVLEEASTAAKACLENPLFKDYFQKLLASRDAIVELILAIDQPSIEAEWKEFKELQSRLKILEYLFTEIEKGLQNPIKKNS